MLIPLLFMGDVVGRLFREFAVTLAVAILISAVVSLTLTPMMCARLLRHAPEREQGRFYRATGRMFDRVIERYGRMLDWVLDRQGATLVVAVATLVLTVVLYLVVPKGFFPVQDTGVIQGISEAPQTVSFAAMAERQQALAKVILQDPAVESLSSFIGVDGTNATLNSGRMLINLKPLVGAGAHAADVIRRLQPELAKVPGITLYMQPVQDLTVEDRISRTQYQFTLEAADGEAAERVGAAAGRAHARGCRSSPTWRATCRTRACRRTSTSTATPRAASASRRRRSTTRSTTRSASGWSRPSSRRRPSTASSSR